MDLLRPELQVYRDAEDETVWLFRPEAFPTVDGIHQMELATNYRPVGQ